MRRRASPSCAFLLVEPRARGSASVAGWSRNASGSPATPANRNIVLWTQSVLREARTLYERSGFTKTAQEPHRLFDVDLVGETWKLEL